MRSNGIRFVFPGILLLAFFGWGLLGNAQEQKHELYLRSQYKIGDVVLEPGYYMVVHGHQRDQEGSEHRTFFYKVPKGSTSETRLSEENEKANVRCRPSEGRLRISFALGSIRQADGTSILRSVQFPGSTVIHNFTQ